MLHHMSLWKPTMYISMYNIYGCAIWSEAHKLLINHFLSPSQQNLKLPIFDIAIRKMCNWQLNASTALMLCTLTIHLNGQITLLFFENITGFLKNHWTKQRLVCTHSAPFSMLITNMGKIFYNSEICWKCSDKIDMSTVITVLRGKIYQWRYLIQIYTNNLFKISSSMWRNKSHLKHLIITQILLLHLHVPLAAQFYFILFFIL